MKRPAFQFYPADWRKDAALQSCSVAAQGLWINVLCVAHECEPYGHLTINGRPMTSAQIGRLVGLNARECDRLLVELIEAGVTFRSEAGAIFSRRMVRDEEIRQRRATGGGEGAEHGIKGREFGKLGGRPKGAKKAPARGDDKGPEKPPSDPPPSSSSSSSASTYSEAIASGGSSPPQPVDLIFGLGLPALQTAGVPEKNARSMLGLMRKTHGDAAVVAAVQRMADERPLEPVAWLQAVLRTAPHKAPAALKSFRERDGDRLAANLHELTGGLLGRPATPPDQGNTIEMETSRHDRIGRD